MTDREKAAVISRRYYLANKDKVNARAKLWKLNNPDKARAVARKSQAKRKAAIAESYAKWYAKNADKKRAYRVRWYNENKERAQAYGRNQRKEYYIKCRDKIRASIKANSAHHAAVAAKRRALKKSLTPATAAFGIIAGIYATAARISKCTGILHHVDHIMPLARGGLHHQSNLQILPAKINLRKGAKLAA